MSETRFVKVKKERNYTVMDNTFLKDKNLSAGAKGVFAYLLSLPSDWVIYQSKLADNFKNGKDSIRKIISELEENGYIVKEKAQGEKGRFTGYNYTIIETPILKDRDGKSATDNPTSEIPPLLNTNNNKILNKQSTDKQISARSLSDTDSSSDTQLLTQSDSLSLSLAEREELEALRKEKAMREATPSKPKSKKTKKEKEEVTYLYSDDFYKPIYERYRHNFFENFKGIPNCKNYKSVTDSVLVRYLDSGLTCDEIRDLILIALDEGLKNNIVINSKYSFSMITSEGIFPGLTAKSKSPQNNSNRTNTKTNGIDYHNQDYNDIF